MHAFEALTINCYDEGAESQNIDYPDAEGIEIVTDSVAPVMSVGDKVLNFKFWKMK